ncbi:MAG: GTP-binding protein [Planctomycetota bacterium]
MNQSNPTIAVAAPLTPAGRSAVAVVGIRPVEIQTFEQRLDLLFSPMAAKPFSMIQRKLVYGRWNSSNEDLVVVRCDDGSIEVHCHGGNLAIESVLDSLRSQGVQVVTAEQFQHQALGRWPAETIDALSRTVTQKTARIIARLMNIQDNVIASLRESILNSDDAPEAKSVEALLAHIRSILSWSKFGRHLTQPRSIVLFGQPNVGKSSLVNQIVGFQRAIVNAKAGTTRDIVTQKTAIGGWPVEFKDTAGLRNSGDVIESIGIEKAKQEIDRADLRIAVLDASSPLDSTAKNSIAAAAPHLVVLNKIDLIEDPQSLAQTFSNAIPVSATTGENMEHYVDAMIKVMVPELPPADQWFPVTDWQTEELTALLHGIEQLGFAAGRTIINQWT